MRRIVFTNDKGGVTKTTSVGNVGVRLATMGHKVLLVDLDSQGDLTDLILGAKPPLIADVGKKYLPATAYTLMTNMHTLSDVIVTAPRYSNLNIIPSNDDIAGANGDLAKTAGGQSLLLDILEEIPEDNYDYVLIDTGKGFDLLVINALAAATDVLILTTPGKFELDAMERMAKRIEQVRKKVLRGGEYPRLLGVVLADSNNYTVARDANAIIQERFPDKLFKTVVPRSDEMRKAVGRSMSIFDYNPKSKVGQGFEALVQEILDHVRETA